VNALLFGLFNTFRDDDDDDTAPLLLERIPKALEAAAAPQSSHGKSSNHTIL